jgi:hypothetical protein
MPRELVTRTFATDNYLPTPGEIIVVQLSQALHGERTSRGNS